MIIVELRGGLGNQLFQYAAGFSLASYHNVPLKLDVSELMSATAAGHTKRDFELTNFHCNLELASEEDIESVWPSTTVAAWLEKFKQPYKRKIYKEASFAFDENFFKSGNSIFLKGYRQSEKYFAAVNEQIKQQYKIKEEFVESVQSVKNEMQLVNSVAVHIRRKDYLSPVYAKVHGVLNAAYYNDAAATILQKTNSPVFYIFSDDMDWVKANFSLIKNAVFITPEESATAITDFYLISNCKHQIIANSTFSWWAAYLNSYKNKIVMAPKKWFNEADYDTKDLIPESWNCI